MDFKKIIILSCVLLGLGIVTGCNKLQLDEVSAGDRMEQVKENGNDIAQQAIKQIDNLKNIEYIKEIHSNGSSQEYWRDLKNNKDRYDEINEDGSLVKKTIFTENGKRVVVVAVGENGQLEGVTYTLPTHISEKNKEIGKISRLKEIQQELKNQEWSFVGIDNLHGVEVKKIESQLGQTLYIDNSGFPIRREYHDGIGKRIEEYKSFNDTSGNIFKVNIPLRDLGENS